MVQLACSCLNVRLHVRESPEALVPGLPGLKDVESKHPFFSKGACLANLSLGGVSEGQKFLVRARRVGDWNVHECLNCHLLTHATHCTSGSLAVSSLLINDANKIQTLQRCDGYSPVFNMVFPTTLGNRPLPPLSPTDFSNKRLPQTEESLNAIQQQISKFLKKAEAQVESNVRAYTEQQQAAFSVLQNRVRRDRQTLMRILSNVQASLQDEDILNNLEMEGARGVPTERADSFSFSDLDKFDEELDKFDEELDDNDLADCEEPDTALPPLVNIQSRVSQPLSMNPTHSITGGMRNLRLSSSVAVPRIRPQGTVRVAQSLDTVGVFDMEGINEQNVVPVQPEAYHSDEDDTDDSNHDEGIHIPGVAGRTTMRDLAQSVPVNVPMFPGSKAFMFQEPVRIERPREHEQMAASMQALARSVHTSSVDLFGDLPRPGRPRMPL